MSRPSATEVRYRLRGRDEIIPETIHAEGALRWLYESLAGRIVLTLALNNRLTHWLYGRWQERPTTRQAIPGFVAAHGLNPEEFELPLERYASFNAFFSRRLKPGARPFEPDSRVLCSPCDGKIQILADLSASQTMRVKGAQFTPEELLGSAEAARPFLGGSAAVLRLAPYDYHRFHFPDSGEVGVTRVIPGGYHSVSPIALTRIPRVFCRNRRTWSELRSRTFGRIAMIEVGALSVGSIVQTHVPGPVVRGDEKGYFQFGGSTVVLLFEPGKITWDPDLLEDSARGIEVQVSAGSRLAVSG